MKRRDLLRTGLAAGTSALYSADKDLLKYLCPPDGTPPYLITEKSPPAPAFKTPLYIPPVKQPVGKLDPPPDPRAHQLYAEYPPVQFYEIHEQEFEWQFHVDWPKSWSWGFDGGSPGPAYHARYGRPILVRRHNSLPRVGDANVSFALPSTTTHLHNAHSASESDGYPADWIDPGEFWDHHYACFPSGLDDREKLTTLWYHDHRLDFTAANVYAGLFGAFLFFDEFDTGRETDPAPAWKLPSGKYDVPLLIQDIRFTRDYQAAFDIFNTDGVLGDRMTVNRKIAPYLEVEPRKYRFRILNGGPSRFYELRMNDGRRDIPFIVLSGDGNFLREPLLADNLYLSVAQRSDIIIDFSAYKDGDKITIWNPLQQTNGKGPSGRKSDYVPDENGIIQFHVRGGKVNDPSRIPDRFRELPPVDLGLVKQHRTWVFDYTGGLWTINGRVFDTNRVDAAIEQGSAEIWTLRNAGTTWSHPIHSHFTEYTLLEVNGRPIYPATIDSKEGRRVHTFYEHGTGAWNRRPPIPSFLGGHRRDVATLYPGDEIKIYMRWQDFLGKYVMHCHNVVHEDHAMMIRWDIVEPGKGDPGPRSVTDVSQAPDRLGTQSNQQRRQELPATPPTRGAEQPRPKPAAKKSGGEL
ncbi:MAG: multicopper oxidase family protein [Bryobacteraceae bacterium]